MSEIVIDLRGGKLDIGIPCCPPSEWEAENPEPLAPLLKTQWQKRRRFNKEWWEHFHPEEKKP